MTMFWRRHVFIDVTCVTPDWTNQRRRRFKNRISSIIAKDVAATRRLRCYIVATVYWGWSNYVLMLSAHYLPNLLQVTNWHIKSSLMPLTCKSSQVQVQVKNRVISLNSESSRKSRKWATRVNPYGLSQQFIYDRNECYLTFVALV